MADDSTYAGIQLASVGVIPKSECPLMSPRDQQLPPISDFRSPFAFVERDS
jgi:hypothetical protein